MKAADFDDVRGLGAAGLLRPALGDGVGDLGDGTPPVDAVEGRAYAGHRRILSPWGDSSTAASKSWKLLG